jgi:hypothetical protein
MPMRMPAIESGALLMNKDQALRDHVLFLLGGGGAHLKFADAVAHLPARQRGRRPAGLPYSPWELIEHMRLCQWDILEFTINPKHVSPKFPQGYWPNGPAPASATAWNRSIKQFQADLQAISKLVANPKTNLTAPLPHAKEYTVLREALLIVDHNAYHLGQLVVVRRLLGAWAI